jgi:hypothetical protein
MWLHSIGSVDKLKAEGALELATPAFDTVRFCQFLAKIAHGFAMANARVSIGVEFSPRTGAQI